MLYSNQLKFIYINPTKMLHYKAAISHIENKDWGAAAQIMAYEIYQDKFLSMGYCQQTELITPIAKRLVFEYMLVARQNRELLAESIPVELAEQIHENTVSCFNTEAICSNEQPREEHEAKLPRFN